MSDGDAQCSLATYSHGGKRGLLSARCWKVLSADGGARFLGGPFLDPKSADLVLFLAAFKIIFKSI